LAEKSLESRLYEIAELISSTHNGKIPLRALIEISHKKLQIEESLLLKMISRMIQSEKLQNLSFILSESLVGLLRDNIMPGEDACLHGFILHNSQRKNVYNEIVLHPGIIFQALKQALNLGTNQLNIYLNQLVNFKLIKFIEVGQSKVFYSSETKKETALLNFLMAKDNFKKVIQILNRGPKRLMEIVHEVNIHHSTVQYIITILINVKVIRVIEQDDSRQYVLNSDVVKTIGIIP